MHLRQLSGILLILQLGLSFVGVIVPWRSTLPIVNIYGEPRADAALTGDSWYEEITGLPFWARIVDVDSVGRIFVLDLSDDVWRSADNGVSWTKVLDDGRSWNTINATTRNWLTLYVDSQDRVFANLCGKTPRTFYRSIDHGDTWQPIISPSRRTWHMDEASNGTLYFHEYEPHWSAIYKSNDGGATWTMAWNLTLESPLADLRNFQIDDYDDTKAWAATSKWIGHWDGSQWVHVYNVSASYYISGIFFDSNFAYTTNEYSGFSETKFAKYSRAPSHNEPPIWYWDKHLQGWVGDEHSSEGVAVDDILLLGYRAELWGSWDGQRWVKIVDLGSTVNNDIMSISHHRPMYFTDKKQGKLYRVNIQKEDLIRLFYTEYNTERGLVTNSENYVLEQRITNGTNYIDLTTVALTNVQASIKGLDRTNQILTASTIDNAGFEWNNLTGWYVDTGGAIVRTSSRNKVDGSHSLRIVKDVSDSGHTYFGEPSNVYTTVRRNEVLIASIYVRSNVALENKAQIIFVNNTSGLVLPNGLYYYHVYASWTRIYGWYTPSANMLQDTASVNVRVIFRAGSGVSYTTYWDDAQVQKLEVGMAFSGGTNEDNVALFEQPVPFFTTTLSTVDPLLTVAGQMVSHDGTLTNGTESSSTNLSGVFTGAVEVNANIQGSRQAILRLTGTRLLYEDSTIIEGRRDAVYYGRYYDTFSPTMITNDLIAVTSLSSNITSLSYTPYTLALTIESPLGTASTIKVHVGDKGEPQEITGATGWNFDNTTQILTISATASRHAILTIEWRIPGDINSDHSVNATDLQLLQQAYGSTPLLPNWNSNADLQEDDCVNVVDLSILGKNYGKT